MNYMSSRVMKRVTRYILMRCICEYIVVAIAQGKKRKSLSETPELQIMQVVSSYEKSLSNAGWVQFTRGSDMPSIVSDVILGCWVKNPRLSYVVATLFSGCILINPKNAYAMIATTVESYGRGLYIDIHSNDGSTSSAGLTQPYCNDRYMHASICIISGEIQGEEVSRLLICCKNFTVQVTCSWRLDTGSHGSRRAYINSACSEAFPMGVDGSTMLFLQMKSVERATRILSGSLNPTFDLSSLRQVESHMCSLDSYRMARATWARIENMISLSPATIFTLNIVRASLSYDASHISVLFSHIAYAANKEGRNATLSKNVVKDAYNKVSSGSTAESGLLELLNMFETEDRIRLFDVKKGGTLEAVLDGLARFAAKALKEANVNTVGPFLTASISKLFGPSMSYLESSHE